LGGAIGFSAFLAVNDPLQAVIASDNPVRIYQNREGDMIVFRRFQKMLAFLLILCLTISSASVANGEAAAALTDLKGHWAEKQMTDWMEKRVHIGVCRWNV